jgi:hypothetical protein
MGGISVYIRLQEILDVIDIFPFKLIINDETKVIINKSCVEKMFLNYEIIKMSVSKEPVIIIQARKYESVTDMNYSFEIGV